MSIFDTIKPINPLNQEEEARLVKLYCSGDREAGNVLIQSQIKWIHSICNNLCSNTHISPEEIIADVLLDVVEALPRYDPSKGKLITFLTPVVAKVGSRYLQSHLDPISDRKRPSGVEKEEVQQNVVLDALIMEDGWYENLDDISIHLREAVTKALGSKVSREVFSRRMKGLGACEIASEVGITPSEVKAVVKNIAASVMSELELRGIECSDFLPLATVKSLQPVIASQRILKALGLGV